jgi:hypothetical protein
MKTINEQINPKFVNQAKKLTQITQLLHQILPVECRNHVQVANVRQQILMLITDSPVWTTRLRQLSPQILQYIHENSSKFDSCFNDAYSNRRQIIHHIQISTRYHTKSANEKQVATKTNLHKPEISKNTAELLSQSANSIGHQQLKTALLKLARHNHSDSTKSISKNSTKIEK